MKIVAETRARHPLAYVLGAFVIAVVCLNVVPGETTSDSIMQTALGAVAMVLIMALADPMLLKKTQSAAGASKKSNARIVGVLLTVAAVLGLLSVVDPAFFGFAPFAGEVGNLASQSALAVDMPFGAISAIIASTDPIDLLSRCVMLVVLVALTGVFEELLFRGIMFRGLLSAFSANARPHPLLLAAAVSAAVFGMMHVSGSAVAMPLSSASQAEASIMAAQSICKMMEATLFGLVMASLFVRTRNIWIAAAAHAGFNLLSTGPAFLASGTIPSTYATGNPADLAVLVVGVVLLAPLAFSAWKTLARENDRTVFN